MYCARLHEYGVDIISERAPTYLVDEEDGKSVEHGYDKHRRALVSYPRSDKEALGDPLNNAREDVDFPYKVYPTLT